MARRHGHEKSDPERKRDADDDCIHGGKLQVHDVRVNGPVGRARIIDIDMPEQAIGYADDRLVLPGLAAPGPLTNPVSIVFQHSGAPLLQISPRPIKSAAKRRGQDQEQKDQRQNKARGRFPIFPINQVNDRDDRERFNRSRQRDQGAGAPFALRAQASERAQHEREQDQARLAEMIVRPDAHHHQKTRDQIEPRVGLTSLPLRKIGRESRTDEPRDGVDRDEHENESALAEHAGDGEKKGAGRRINEIVFAAGAQEINFVAGENVPARFVPGPVIDHVLAAETAQQRPDRKDEGDSDKDRDQSAEAGRRVQPAIDRRPPCSDRRIRHAVGEIFVSEGRALCQSVLCS